MKIVQSFAQFDDGCKYYVKGRLGGSEVYLNFYSFLLSYLTLKKYYGSVTMYCNKKAYDTFIKYIPYDNIILKENKNTQFFWSAYKIDVIGEMKEPFIHVDSDVFIFDDLFKKYINNQRNYDVIVQNILTPNINPIKNFVVDNINYLSSNKIININDYDNRCCSCGVIGMNLKVRDVYVKNTQKIRDMIISNVIVGNYNSWIGMILEELTLYLTICSNKLRGFDVLPYSDIIKYGEIGAGAHNNYTHMWFATKFVKRNIELIKNKIKKEFPKNYIIVEDYDKYISNFDIKYLSHIDNY